MHLNTEYHKLHVCECEGGVFLQLYKMLLPHTVLLVLLMVGDWCQRCRRWWLCATFTIHLQPWPHLISGFTHPLQPSLPHSHQDQRGIGSSESVILYSALEICGAHRERKKHMSGGSLALTHLAALVLSYTFHLFYSTTFLLHPAPHRFITPLSQHYQSILSLLVYSSAKQSSYISEVYLSLILSCWLSRCLSLPTLCHPPALTQVRITAP